MMTEQEREAREMAKAIGDLPKMIDAVTTAYLNDGRHHTLPEVAELTGVPIALLRRVNRELTSGWAPRDAIGEMWQRRIAEARGK